MTRFQLHHQDSIRFGYSCFDRIILHGSIPEFCHTARGGHIRWFLESQRHVKPCRKYFAQVSSEYHERVESYARNSGVDILDLNKLPRASAGEDLRREELVRPYFLNLGTRPGLAVILKARESARMAVHFAKKGLVGVESRFVNVYYFYRIDPQCGPMFVRICPYFPFNIDVWMNGHNWLARQMQHEGIDFVQRDNLFVECAKPERLQELADGFSPADIQGPIDAWLSKFVPFFSAEDRQRGYRHQLYMYQMEYCHNLLFHKRAALDRLFDRLMDANRSMGRPDKLAIFFNRARFQPVTRDGRITMKRTVTRTPVLTAGFKRTGIKQYVSNGEGLRTESSSHQLKDLGMPKNIANLPKLRQVFDQANQRYLQVQQDILATFVDRGELQKMRQPSFTPTGRRLPGLRIDDPRLMAVVHAFLCFAYLAGKAVFRTRDLLADVQKALDNPNYRLSQLRYDLTKFRGKGLLQRLPGTQSYQLTEQGTRLAVCYMKIYQRFYAPLTSAIQAPFPGDERISTRQQSKLDRLYVALDDALKELADNLGFAA
jgi:hypothetical protein